MVDPRAAEAYRAVDDDDVELVRRSIARRLAYVTGGVAVVLGAFAFFALAPIERAAVARTTSQQIGLIAEAVAASYQVTNAPLTRDEEREEREEHEAPEQRRVHRADEILEQLRQAQGVAWIDVIDHAGRVTQSTRSEHKGELHLVPRRLREVTETDEHLVVSYAMPFTQACAACHAQKADPVGVVQVAVDRELAVASLQRFHLFYAAAVFSMFALLVLVILVATNRMVARPAFKLARLMRKAERGDFLVRARVEGDDELGALARAFNQMLRAITTMKAQEIEREAQLREASAELSMKKQLEELAERLKKSNAALERRVQAQGLLMDAAHRLGSTLDKGAMIEGLSRVVEDKLRYADFAVYLVEEEAERKEAVLRVSHARGRYDNDDVRALRFHVGEGVTGLVAETGAPVLIADLSNPPQPEGAGVARERLPDEGALLVVPMLHKGRVVGVLDFYAARPNAFDADDVALLQALGALVAMAVVNADLYQTTLELSVTDTLTGLMNRRALNRILDAELVRAQRFNTPLVVLMLDVDHFKQYNDRMGHLLGDEALKAVAGALAQSIRKVDAIARFGGEEFCVVLPRTDENAGIDVADKLLRAVRSLELLGAPSQPLGRMSISVGLAVYPDDMPPAVDGPLVDALLDAADKAAYEAKRGGRDRSVTAGEISGRPRRPKLNEPQRPLGFSGPVVAPGGGPLPDDGGLGKPPKPPVRES